MKQTPFSPSFFAVLLRLIPARGSRRKTAPAASETLRELPPGGRARIAGFDLPMNKCHRLLEMGFTVGTPVHVVRLAPLNDPIEVRVRGYHLSLRRAEAAGIHIVAEGQP